MEVSIIIPVYNRATLVGRTLDSLVAQTHRRLHVILVDNNSSDNTRTVLDDFKRKHEGSDFRITVLEEKRSGACAARNTGMRAATSEWIMFFDSDDTMDARLVEKYVQKIDEAGGEVDMVATRSDVVNIDGIKHLQPYYEKDLIVNHLFHSCLSTQRYIVRRELMDRIGGWNENLPCWNDWELGIRLLFQHPRITFLNDAVYVHVFLSRISITGTSKGDKCGQWEQAIDAIEDIIRKSDEPDKARYLKFIEFRRITLAGLYANERRYNLARNLYESTYARVRHDKIMSWLYPLLYKYIGAGGIGASHIVKWLVK